MSGTFLVVEHDESQRLLLARAFLRAGISSPILFLSDGAEAIAFIRRHGKSPERVGNKLPALVLTDLNMPGDSGFDVLREIRSHPAWHSVPAVVLSSSSDPDDIRTACDLGASAYCVKPNVLQELVDLLENLCRSWKISEPKSISGNRFTDDQVAHKYSGLPPGAHIFKNPDQT